MNRTTNQDSNTGVDRRLSFLALSLTGYDWSPRRDLEPGTIEHYTTVGHESRARVFKQALRRLTQAIVGTSRRVARALKHRRLRRASIRQLAALTDHQLKDIGLLRAEIPVVVERSLRNESQPAAEPKAKVVTISEATNPANDDGSQLAA